MHAGHTQCILTKDLFFVYTGHAFRNPIDPKDTKAAKRLAFTRAASYMLDATPRTVGNMDKKQAAEFAKNLDKIADQVKKARPDLAKRIWIVADWLEGDSDEARYMKRYDTTAPYERDADEKFMDTYGDMPKQPASHSEVSRRTEGPVKDLNTTPKVKNPHEDKAVADYHWASSLKQASTYLDKLADWVQEKGDEDLAFKIDQIADGVDDELAAIVPPSE